jgi:hypothetical protein
MIDLQDGTAGVEPPGDFLGAGQLTQGAAGAEIKMGSEKHPLGLVEKCKRMAFMVQKRNPKGKSQQNIMVKAM